MSRLTITTATDVNLWTSRRKCASHSIGANSGVAFGDTRRGHCSHISARVLVLRLVKVISFLGEYMIANGQGITNHLSTPHRDSWPLPTTNEPWTAQPIPFTIPNHLGAKTMCRLYKLLLQPDGESNILIGRGIRYVAAHNQVAYPSDSINHPILGIPGQKTRVVGTSGVVSSTNDPSTFLVEPDPPPKPSAFHDNGVNSRPQRLEYARKGPIIFPRETVLQRTRHVKQGS